MKAIIFSALLLSSTTILAADVCVMKWHVQPNNKFMNLKTECTYPVDSTVSKDIRLESGSTEPERTVARRIKTLIEKGYELKTENMLVRD